jgi:hypothetical protein
MAEVVEGLEDILEAQPVEETEDRPGPGWSPLPSAGVLRPWDFTVVSRSRTGRVLTYEARDADSGEAVGDVGEVVTPGDRLLRAFALHRSQMQGKLVLTDCRDGEPLLLIERGPFKGVVQSRPCVVKLYGPRGSLLAWFEAGAPHLAGLMVDWNADCSIYDAQDRPWATAEGPKYPRPDWDIRDRDGRLLARVRGEGRTSGWFAPGISWTAQGGELRVSLNERAVEGPAWKLALLGAAVAYESIISSLRTARP